MRVVIAGANRNLFVDSALRAFVFRRTFHLGDSLFVYFCAFSWLTKSVTAKGRAVLSGVFRGKSKNATTGLPARVSVDGFKGALPSVCIL